MTFKTPLTSGSCSKLVLALALAHSAATALHQNNNTGQMRGMYTYIIFSEYLSFIWPAFCFCIYLLSIVYLYFNNNYLRQIFKLQVRQFYHQNRNAIPKCFRKNIMSIPVTKQPYCTNGLWYSPNSITLCITNLYNLHIPTLCIICVITASERESE